MNYVWIVLGDASGVPVYAVTRKYVMFAWLTSRRGNSMLRLFRLTEGANSGIEVCIPCFLRQPMTTVHKRGSHD